MSSVYTRLMKRISVVKLTDDVSKILVGVSRSTLEMYPVTSTSSPTAMPTSDEVESFMQSLVPSPTEVFSGSFFRNPLFSVVTLHDVAKYYDCLPFDACMLDSIGFSNEDKKQEHLDAFVICRISSLRC